MKNERAYSIEDFFHTFFRRTGALIDKPSFGLLEAVLPPDLAAVFGTEELLLAFDYEVALETPGSIFIAPGSATLDTVVQLASNYGLYTIHYWPGTAINQPKNLIQKTRKAVDFLYCRPPRIINQYPAENVYYIFNFICSFRSYKITEEIIPVVINASSGVPIPALLEYWENLIPSEKPYYKLGKAPIIPPRKLYSVACKEVKVSAERRASSYWKEGGRLLQKELAKTENYYRETLLELTKKQRNSNDEIKRGRLQDQINATWADFKHRQDDLAARYDLEVEVKLDHLIAYHVPCLFLQVAVQHKNSITNITLIYNPLSGEVESPPCPICGLPASVLMPGKNGGLACPAHE